MLTNTPYRTLIRTAARNEVISTSSSMRNLSSNRAIRIDHNAVRTWLAAIVDAAISHERELVVRARNAVEAEAFVVVVDSGVSNEAYVSWEGKGGGGRKTNLEPPAVVPSWT